MTTEDLLTELFKRGQLIRDAWWNSYKANLDRIGAELRANEAFVGDYGHLVAQLPEAPQMPFGHSVASGGIGHSPSPAPGASYGPPPIPETSYGGPSPEDLAFEARMQHRREEWGGGRP